MCVCVSVCGEESEGGGERERNEFGIIPFIPFPRSIILVNTFTRIPSLRLASRKISSKSLGMEVNGKK